MTSTANEHAPDDRPARHRELEAIALTALQFGKLLMECGARGRVVDAYVVDLAKALGVERAETRAGYASLEMTVQKNGVTSTRMIVVGYHGVNQRLDQALRRLVRQAQAQPMTPDAVDAEIERLRRIVPHHPHWLMAVAAGLACAAFARLLGADWAATAVVLAAATLGQTLRTFLRLRKASVFVISFTVGLAGSLMGGYGACFAGSATVPTAMIASILMLVPGVPSLNALSDILEGRPTLGSARAITVIVIMAFATTGLWLASLLLNVGLTR
jgi:uncharacterized membrane protein YjjP (DUF1212 family)